MIENQAALHALANIAGEPRAEHNIILNSNAEESLRRMIYEVASRSSKLTPSVSLLLSHCKYILSARSVFFV